jgi:hypothetical protein
MSGRETPALDRVILSLLAALVVTNITLLILARTGGPLIGLAFYLVLLALTVGGRQRDHRAVMVGGLVGVAVHVVEAVTMGSPDHQVLLGLNLILPAALALAAWGADRGPRRKASGR